MADTLNSARARSTVIHTTPASDATLIRYQMMLAASYGKSVRGMKLNARKSGYTYGNVG